MTFAKSLSHVCTSSRASGAFLHFHIVPNASSNSVDSFNNGGGLRASSAVPFFQIWIAAELSTQILTAANLHHSNPAARVSRGPNSSRAFITLSRDLFLPASAPELIFLPEGVSAHQNGVTEPTPCQGLCLVPPAASDQQSIAQGAKRGKGQVSWLSQSTGAEWDTRTLIVFFYFWETGTIFMGSLE